MGLRDTYIGAYPRAITTQAKLTFALIFLLCFPFNHSALSNNLVRSTGVNPPDDVPVVPTLSGIETTALAYTEGQAATVITSTTTIADPDNTQMVSATISFTAGYHSTEDVLAFSNAFGITGSWNSATGVLTLSGTRNISNYVNALRAVTYQNTNNNNPSPVTRTVQFTVNDGTGNSAAVSRNITITNVNTNYTLLASTAEISANCFAITPAISSQYGALWRKVPTTLQTPFEINFDARFSANGVVNDGGADGIVFVLQRDNTPPPTNAAGSPTTAIGANGVGLGYGGISPSIGVTFDTYSNVSQPAYDFISLSKDGNINTLLTAAVSAKVDGSNNPVNIEDGVYHSVKISWQKSTNTLRVYFDGVERINYSEDFINTVFGGDPTNIYWGFTAATGGFSNEQSVCSVNMNFAPTTVADAYTVLEGGTINQAAPGVLANDTDPEAGTLTTVLGTTTTNGTLTLNANGSFTYVHNGSETTSDSFTYRVSDGSATGDLVTVSITVTPVNDAPVAANNTFTTNEDTPLTVALANSVLMNDTDAEGSALTAALVAGPANGTLTFNANGTFTYTPNANYNGSDTFTYRANDGTANSNTATVTITLNAVNDAPVAVNNSYTTNEDTPLTVALANSVLVNDTDIDANTLTAVLDVGPTNGTLTLNANGTFTYTPSANYNGSDSFTYHASDGTANSNIATVTITINAVNDVPVAVNNTYATNEDTPLTVALANSVLVNDTDVEGNAITAVLDANPANGTLTLNANGTFTYTPNANYNGSDTFTYHANDGTGNSNNATVTITVSAVNDVPVAVNNTYTTNEDTPLTVALANSVLVNDTDVEGSALTAVLDAGPSNGTLTLNANGTFTYTPNANYNGSDNFTYHANDGTGNSNIATVTVTVNAVNDVPVAVNNSYTTNEDTPVTVALANSVLVNDSDVEGNTLTAVLDAGPANGTLTLSANGTFTYTPNANYNGSDSFTYHANDGTGNSNIATVTVTVNAVNDVPVAGNDAYTTNEDTPLTVVLANRILLNDTDVEGSALTAVLDAGPSNGTLTLNANGTFTYSPNTNYNGSDSFTYHANDGTGNSNIATVTITVNAVNDLPVAVNNTYTTNEDSPLTVVLANSVLVNDTDTEGSPLNAVLDASPTNGTLTLNANGTFTYTPNANYNGSDTFTYHANDGTGNSNIATVTITINAINDIPVAVNNTYTTNEDTPLTVTLANNVLLNDTDVEGNTLTAVLDAGPANGTLTLNADGTFTYTPSANYNGSDSFTYHASDGTGNSNIATVTITINAVNDAPVAVNDAYITNEDTPLTVIVANRILVNDTDVEGSALTAVLDVGPANGALTLNANGTFTYTPNANYNGSDNFTYHANDGTVNSNIATVSITINAVNDAPVAVNDVYSTNEDTPLTAVLANRILLNDTDTEGNTLTAVLDAGPSNGTLTLNANGTFTYTPSANYNGSDSFTYHANDGTGNSNIATVTITVHAVNDVPVAVNNTFTTNEDTPLTIVLANSILVNDTDVEGNTLTAILDVGPANGTLTLNANGTFTYTPSANYNGGDTFTYHANDGIGNSNIASVTLTINAVNDLPVAVNNTYTTNEDTPLTVVLANGVLVNDTDTEGNTLTAVLDAGPSNGTLTLNANGTLTYTPSANYNGSDSFTYHANDGTGNSNIATVTITVSPVNDAPVAVNDGYNTNEDTPLTVVPASRILLNDTDVEGNALTAVLDVAPANGTLTLNTNGTFTYTPNTNYSGSDTFTYHANDGTNNSNIATVTITINAVNDLPVAANNVYTTNEDTPLTIAPANSVLTNDTDTEGNTLTAVLDSGPSNGTLTLNANGTFTYTPSASYNGSDTFTYHANDGSGNSNIATVTITITPVNDAPVAVTNTYSTNEDTPLTVILANSILVNDTDTEGNALTAVLDVGPTNGTLTLNANGTFTYTPSANYYGSDTFTYHANDGIANSNIATVTITINAVNDVPVAANNAYTTNEDTPLTVVLAGSILVNDTDVEGNTLTAVLDGGPVNGTLTLSANGTFIYTPSANYYGSDIFTYHANDGTGNSNIGTVTITVSPVNDAPVATNDAYTINEDTPLTVVLANRILLNDTDTEGNALTAMLDAGPVNGTLTLNANGTFTYTPNTNYNGSDIFTYHANDGTGNSNIATVTITITPVNDAPVAVNDTYSTNEDTPLAIILANRILLNDTDVEGNVLTAVLNAGPANGTLTLNANGTFTYTPNANYNGSDNFTYHANDGTGNSNTATVTITVSPVNDAPVAANDAYITNEDTPFTVALANSVLTNDADAEGNALTAALNVGPTNGTLTLNANGTFTYTPSANYSGSDTFTYHSNDGTDNSNIATVTITVSPINDAPVAVDDAYSINEDTPLTIAVANRTLLNDTDVDGNALTAVLDAGPSNGTLTLNANGTFSYTPNADYNGSDTFTYHANDGTENSNIATVTITVNPVNDAPVAVNDTYTTGEDSPLTTVLANSILSNDTDIEGSTLTAVLDAGPTHGSLTLNPDGTFTYTPTANYNGNDSFTYHANDGTTNSTIVTVIITINDINDAPIAVNDAYATNEDTPLAVALANSVLVNDTDTEGNTLTAILDASPSNGTLAFDGDGTFTYTPSANFSGSETLTYHVNDGTNNSNIATVTITISPVNDAPVAASDAYTTNEDTPLTAVLANSVLANDTDAEGNVLTVVLDTSPSNGTLTLNADGTFTYTPAANYNGNDTFTYHVNDGTVNSNIATVTITVAPVNDPPLAVDDGPMIHNSMLPITIDALANDSDPNNTLTDLTIISISTPTFGNATIENGMIVYKPSGTESGTVTFTYTIQDPGGLTSTATITLYYEYLSLEVSQGFSPNNAGGNETWYIRSIESYPDNRVRVFDRWGILVFEAKHYDNSAVLWDGIANTGMLSGKNLDQGTYYYVIDLGNEGKALTGYVMLVR